MPKYKVHATVNYPETEADTPDAEPNSDGQLLQWITKLLVEPDATSFVITVVKRD